MRKVVEGLNPVGAEALVLADASCVRTLLASDFPSSTPHWSKELIPHMNP